MKKTLKNIFYTTALGATMLFSNCKEGEDPKPRPDPEPTPKKEITLDAKLANNIDINYNGKLKNLNQANFEVYKNGKEIAEYSKTISENNYSGKLEDLQKGNYELKTYNEDISANKKLEVPNYEPTFNSDGLENYISQNSEINWNLKDRLNDPNIEDTVKIESIKSLDNKLDITINGYEVNLKPKNGAEGLSELETKFISGNDEITKNMQIKIEEIAEPVFRNFSGVLQDNRTNSNSEGKLNIYEGKIPTIYGEEVPLSKDNFLGQIETDNQGNYNFEVPESIDGNIIAESIQNGDINKNYARVVELNEGKKDTIRTHEMSDELYNELINSGHNNPKDAFRNFMEEINGKETGVTKWDLDDIYDNVSGRFKGILINDNFTQNEQKELETILKDNLFCYTGEKISGNELVIEKNYDGESNSGENRWIHVKKDTTINAQGDARNNSSFGEIYNSKIRIKNFTQPVNSHEFGHATQGMGHSNTLQAPLTNRGLTASPPENPGPADCEAGFVLYDKHTKPEEFYYNVLKLNFNNFQPPTEEKVIDKLNSGN